MKKRLLSCALALCMLLGMSMVAFATEMPEMANKVVQPSASVEDNSIDPRSGEELWNGHNIVYVGTFTMTGNNLTPVKTTGYTGPLAIITDYTSTRSNTPVLLRVEIRDWATQEVIAYNTTTVAKQSGRIVVQGDVGWHQKIQIFIKVYDKNGNYDTNLPCKISYSYTFYNASE